MHWAGWVPLRSEDGQSACEAALCGEAEGWAAGRGLVDWEARELAHIYEAHCCVRL